MSMQLAEISQTVSAGAHAVVLLDQAGWHTSSKLSVPANISLLPLPPKSPELNPVEYVWSYLKTKPLANLACPNVDELAVVGRRHARSIQRQPHLLRSFIRHSPLSLRLA